MNWFTNKSVLVTGAASGIGYTTALSFARAGARVAAVDRDDAGLQCCVQAMKAENAIGIPVLCDVSHEDCVAKMVDAVGAHFGGIDILVTCAAVFLMKGTLVAGEDQWAQSFQNNVSAGALCSRYASEWMRRAGGGAIVLVSSISGWRAERGFATYSCSKAAILMLARCMAVDLADGNIRVNSVSPGPVDGTMLHRFAEQSPHSWDDLSAAICKRQCITRMVQPQDVANVIMFLASPWASMVTGANIVVDGGYTVR